LGRRARGRRRGAAFVTGRTISADFPTTEGAFDRTRNAEDAFVANLDPTGGALVYSTYLGGSSSEEGTALAIDDAGNAYISGHTRSSDFPVTPGAFDTTANGHLEAFATKVNSAGTALIYSTFLGGANVDIAAGIAIDTSAQAYVVGRTGSANYPTTPGAFDNTFNGDVYDAFVTKLSAAGSALGYSTVLGGSSTDLGRSIALDRAAQAAVTGATNSSNFPTTNDAFDPSYNERYDAFVTRLNAGGSGLAYSTFLGGTYDFPAIGEDRGQAIAVDRDGYAYVAGLTSSRDFPTTPGAFDRTYNLNDDAFVAKLPTPFLTKPSSR
jgi:hypothetical protein